MKNDRIRILEAETPSTASVVQPPKRRKYQAKKHVQNKSRMMPEERISNELVDSDSSEQKLSIDLQEPINVQHNLRMDGSDSNSDQKYFPLLSKSIARSSEAKRTDLGNQSKKKLSPQLLIITRSLTTFLSYQMTER